MSWILTNPVRRIATDRERILAEAGIDGSTEVLEVGAGNGFFTEILAPAAATVYAVELQEQMVRKLYRRLENIPCRSPLEIRVGDIARVEIPPGSCDLAFVYFSFHELQDADASADAIGRILRPESGIYLAEPRVEVSAGAFQKTLLRLRSRGFIPTQQWTTFFTRGALLRRTPPVISSPAT